MKNPCNNCKTRIVCAPYGGRCLRKKLYLIKTEQELKKYADAKVNELRNYVNESIATVERMMEDADQAKA